MKKLYVIDMSGLVWHGHTGDYTNQLFRKLPVAGINSALNTIAFTLGEGADVVAAFDSKESIRKSIFPGYKSGRIPNRQVYVQLDFLWEQLPNLGICCLKEDGYEADDLINWTIKEYLDQYDQIAIMSGDEDLTHNVQPKVTYEPFVKSRPIVNDRNFSITVIKGEKIAFNTISAHKVFCGCKSDTVPAFKAEDGRTGKALYSIFVNVLEKNNRINDYESTTSKELIRYFVDNASIFTENDRKQLNTRINVIYPLERPDGLKINPTGLSAVNKHLLAEMLSMSNNTKTLRWLDLNKVSLSQSFLDVIDDYAFRFNTGAYAVDNNLEVDPSYLVDSQEIDLMEEF